MKLNQEELNNIFQNAMIALNSISSLLPECSSLKMKEELIHQYEGYQAFAAKITAYMQENGYEQKDINPMKKAMLFTSVKLNTITDDSCSHTAEMMIKGTVMGITELTQLITRGEGKVDKEVTALAKQLLKLEEDYEKRLKGLL